MLEDVEGKQLELDLTPPPAIRNYANSPWTPERVELLKQLHAKGLSAGQIAKELWCTRNAVIGKLDRIGLSFRQPKLSKIAAPKIETPKRGKHRMVHNPQRAARLLALMQNMGEGPEPEYDRFDLKVPAPRKRNGVAPTWRNAGVFECKWPLGTSLHEDGFYCGAAVVRGSYCAEHGARAYDGRDNRHKFSSGGYSIKSSMWR